MLRAGRQVATIGTLQHPRRLSGLAQSKTMRQRIRHSTHLSIEAMQALVALIDGGGLAGAAKILGYGEPVISNRLKAFRGTDPLLTKEGRELRLTTKGKAALPAIRGLLRQFEHLKQHMAGKYQQPHLL